MTRPCWLYGHGWGEAERATGAAGRLWAGALIVVVCAFPALLFAQIGGKTAADGPFTLDDVEDLDLVAGGVMRNWVYGTLPSGEPSLQAISLATSGLILAPGQTSIGALRFRAESVGGYINGSFGVPMPGEPGASTLVSPGNITSFTNLTFLACFSPAISGQVFNVILETYPGPNYPELYWSFTPAAGKTFQEVSIDLWHPGLIQNANGLTIDQLLSQTRYLSFYCYAYTGFLPETLTLNVDDIHLIALTSGSGATPPATSSPTPTPTPLPSPTETFSSVPSEFWICF